MKIKVLGTGCSGCKALYETVQKVVTENGIDAIIEKEEDLIKIMSYNIMALPGLVIDEIVVSAGKRLSAGEIKALLIK